MMKLTVKFDALSGLYYVYSADRDEMIVGGFETRKEARECIDYLRSKNK
jgi:hypothetical protein